MATIISLTGAGIGVSLVPASAVVMQLSDVEFLETRGPGGARPAARIYLARGRGRVSKAVDNIVSLLSELVSERPRS